MIGTTSGRIHRDLRLAARFIPRQPVGPRTLPLVRRLAAIPGRRRPSDVEIRSLPSGASVRIHRGGDSGAGLVWIHGGGYVLGTAAQDDVLCRRFAAALGITVVSVDYRLAPRHPYPAALDDCEAALRLLAGVDGIDPQRLAVGGASAGGGLAAALAQRVVDSPDLDLRFSLLVYPMLDDRTGLSDVGDESLMRLWNSASNRFGWASYLGVADASIAVPARRDDLAGLPATWIGVGDCDLFADEGRRYAERLRSAGVECRFDVVDGAFHGFDLVLPRAGVSRTFFATQVAALRAALL